MRGSLNSRAGRFALAAAVLCAAVAAGISLRGVLGHSAAADAASRRLFICARTGTSFMYRLSASDTLPVTCPCCGTRNGFPAERCTWTKEGQVKKEPTAVLLNRYRGKPEPTFCPDCGRLVVGHNPQAEEGRSPPPTREEYEGKTRNPKHEIRNNEE